MVDGLDLCLKDPVICISAIKNPGHAKLSLLEQRALITKILNKLVIISKKHPPLISLINFCAFFFLSFFFLRKR